MRGSLNNRVSRVWLDPYVYFPLERRAGFVDGVLPF
jgi:hypothetical protein